MGESRIGPRRTVAIVGVGLIGGSLGLAVRRRLPGTLVVGIGRNRGRLERARRLGAVDRFTVDLADGIRGAGLVVLCSGVDTIPAFARRILPLLEPGAILTDAGSVKDALEQAIAPHDPEGRFIGSHPIAGSEKTGVEHARADLFEGAVCVVTETARNRRADVLTLARFWRRLGARVVFMDPAGHDAILGEISHLPHLLASALVAAVSKRSLDFSGTGFRDTTRIAASSPELWTPILLDNRRNLLRGLRRFSEILDRYGSALRLGNAAALTRLLRSAGERRRSLGGRGTESP